MATATSNSSQPFWMSCARSSAADAVGPGLLGLAGAVALGEDDDAHGAPGAGGEDDGAPHLLIGVAGVDAQAEVGLHGGVELGGEVCLTRVMASWGW